MSDQEKPTLLKHWKDRTFQDQVIDLDGNSFENCTFVNCKIRYAGGPYHLEGGFGRQNVNWEFDRAALRTIQLLRVLQGEAIFRAIFPQSNLPPGKPI